MGWKGRIRQVRRAREGGENRGEKRRRMKEQVEVGDKDQVE